MSLIRAEGGDGFNAPGPSDFNLPPAVPWGGDSTFQFLGETHTLGVTKPMIQLVLAAVIVFVVFYYAAKQRKIVPGKLQFAGEEGYGFVRNSLGRDIIGSEQFQRFVPYLFVLFFFILVNNFFASIPFIQFPTFSRVGMAYALAIVSWGIYNGVGIKKHGFLGYLKHTCVPTGVPLAMLPLLVFLEFFSNILVRPVTLALRLFANMLAGHLLLILFALGGEHLLLEVGGAMSVAGIVAWIMFIVIAFLEILIQFLQAYVFVLLNAIYISGAVSDEH